MDRISKFLRKLSSKERETVEQIISRVLAHNFSHLDVKKLKGEDNIFRIRKGNIRIKFQKREDVIFILSIERRSNTT